MPYAWKNSIKSKSKVIAAFITDISEAEATIRSLHCPSNYVSYNSTYRSSVRNSHRASVNSSNHNYD